MINGWRKDPAWVALYDARRGSKEVSDHMAKVAAVQEQQKNLQAEYNERQKVEIAKQEEHRRECHAQKEAAGELTSQRAQGMNS